MKKTTGWIVVTLAISGFATANEFRLFRPFEGSNVVEGSQFGVRTDMALDRSSGQILLKRKFFPVQTHLDGRWNVFIAALDGPLSKRATVHIIASDADDNVIGALRERANRKKVSTLGLRTNSAKVDALSFTTGSITWDIPPGGRVDMLIELLRQRTGPGDIYVQIGMEDDDGDSDSD